MSFKFDKKDIDQIIGHGLTQQDVGRQLDSFVTGFGPLPVDRPATTGDGIASLTEERISAFMQKYDDMSEAMTVVKFVPASGAATRMMKDLFEFVNEGKKGPVVEKLLDNINKFAFYPALSEIAGPGSDGKTIVESIVGSGGLGYGTAPKALIPFHSYPDRSRTALEEHLAEGAMYAASQGTARIHFTVSPEHMDGFVSLVKEALPYYENRFGVKYDISYSTQKSGTDTIAVTPDNQPFRNADGSLLFRPAGHGALLENLDAIDADIIFVKNIDNVTTDRLKGDTVKYKKALGGLLLDLQEKAFGMIGRLDRPDDPDILEIAAEFVEKELCRKLPASFAGMEPREKRRYLRNILDRPIRVCGMVRNLGEPGGGPFRVTEADGSMSLQIAESSQIAPDKAHLMAGSTHFNPVDLVCGTRNHAGVKFDLSQYTDPSTGFISLKSKDGRELKAQELPGLWNGSMAGWNTVFAEVPVSTFSPVKVVTDLLRDEHQ